MERRGVRSDGGGQPAASREALIRSVVGGWRDSLTDLTAASRLLDFRPGQTGVIKVSRPSADEVLARIRAGGTFTFRSLKPWPAGSAPGEPATLPPPAPYILDTGLDPDGLDTALRALMRHSAQEYTERGLPVLYLAFGTVAWAERDRTRYCAPVLLVPVRLVSTEPWQPPMLEPADEDPVVNPALRLKLAQYGIVFPRVGDPAEAKLGGLLDGLRTAVASRDGWQDSETVALSGFPVMREAMYQDLLEHEDLVMRHPVVRSLAGGAQPRSVFDRAAPVEPGNWADDEPLPLVLPADSPQRLCVAAALGGHSFVLDGPPGTGKSQTIANMIGALLHAGRTVLMVSGKAAALDTVRDRLAGVGLGGFLLELHSRAAAREQVAAALAAALDTLPGTADDPADEADTDGTDDHPPADADTPAWQDAELQAYAGALHRVREPLGYSLHDVLAMVASLPPVPAPATGLSPADLTVDLLREIRGDAEALVAAWRPAAEGRSFAWRGVAERGSLDDQLYRAASALEALAGAVQANQTLAEATGLTHPSGAQALSELVDHLLTWPEGLPDEWLTMDTLETAELAVTQLAAALTAISAREQQVSQAAGCPWQAIPTSATLPDADGRELAGLVPEPVDVSGLSSGQIAELAQDFAADADLLEDRFRTLTNLAGVLGLRTPSTFGQANDLMVLARLAGEPDRPERAWLSVAGHRAASHAARVLHDAHHAMARAESAASAFFTPDALHYDVASLAHRFASEYQRLGRLSGDYRTDKRTVSEFTRMGVPAEAAAQHLGLAAAWQHAAQVLAGAEANYASVLGSYYAGRATDFDRLGRALGHAAIAVRCARGQDLWQAAGHISCDAPPKPGITAALAEIRQDFAGWQAALAPPPTPAARPELMNGTIPDAIGWLRAHLTPLRAASEYTRILGEVAGLPNTLGHARHLVALREAADAAHDELTARDEVFTDLCGSLYAGAETDLVALRDALIWAKRLREVITGGPGPLSEEQLRAAESAVPTERLAETAAAWHDACAALLVAFSPDHRQELASDLDDYVKGDALLEAMFNDPRGRDDWHAYAAARAALAAHGLDAVAEFCVASRVAPAQVPQVIELAILRDWAEYEVRADPALTPLRSVSSDALVSGYQRLDGALSTAAAGEVARACAARRARPDGDRFEVIRAEAARNDKHVPVRSLLEQAGHEIQALKPCFLMPPPAVSQYLPASLRFDAVIFDEASQLSPADAINCIYRGGTVILAGDQQQLPPGGAAGQVSETPSWPGQPTEPESVLDLAKKSGAFAGLGLHWHYRSRHEALIEFSNAEFYSGRLIPLTGRGGGAEAGLGLLRCEGTYRAATTRDNPLEAARVVDRIIHHCQARPGQSLGVVTFNDAQAAAIESALVRVRKQRPALEEFFASDRLRGFFVKHAELVQGDERDVVIVSTGYALDENGALPADFGPLTGPGGWRRLNVAVTRARYRTEIVTSLSVSDIPETVASPGLKLLRGYLEYATGGRPERLAR